MYPISNSQIEQTSPKTVVFWMKLNLLLCIDAMSYLFFYDILLLKFTVWFLKEDFSSKYKKITIKLNKRAWKALIFFLKSEDFKLLIQIEYILFSLSSEFSSLLIQHQRKIKFLNMFCEDLFSFPDFFNSFS
jgi:hypothetical protein